MSKILNVETRSEPLRARLAPMEPPGRLEEVHTKLDRLTADLAELRREIWQLRQVVREPPPASRAGSSAVSRFLRLSGWVAALLLTLVVWMTDPAAPLAVTRWVQRVTMRLVGPRAVTPPRAPSMPTGPAATSSPPQALPAAEAVPSASQQPATDAAPVSSGMSLERPVAL